MDQLPPAVAKAIAFDNAARACFSAASEHKQAPDARNPQRDGGLPSTPKIRFLFDAAVAVEGTIIVDVGPSADVLARYADAERVDGSGKAVLPGFANLHTHFELTLARGIYEDLSPPHAPPFAGGMAEFTAPGAHR